MSDKGSDSEEYEVDEIVDKRIHKGQTQYLVQWVGYSAGTYVTNAPTNEVT